MNTWKIMNLAQALHNTQKELDEIVRVNYGSQQALDDARNELVHADLYFDKDRIGQAYLHAKNRMDVYLTQYRPVRAQFIAIKNALKTELNHED